MKRAVGLVVAAAVVGSGSLAGAAGRDPIDEARRAAQTTPFSGVVTLQWRDGSTVHDEQVQVEGADGTVVVQGRRVAMARGTERLLQDASGWQLMSPSSAAPSLPDTEPDYDFSAGLPAVVAGHAAHVVEVRKDGVVRERLYLDDATGLLLRRDEFADDGTLDRAVAFQQITIRQAPVTAPPFPKSVANQAPRPLSAAVAPLRLAAGYERLAAFKTGSVVHVLYNDGFSDVSLFEQRGRLDRDQLPAHARRVAAASLEGWTFAWPGGEALVWGAGRTVYTLVGDVPADELVQVALSVPRQKQDSVAHRLRQACRSLVEAFSGDL